MEKFYKLGFEKGMNSFRREKILLLIEQNNS